MEFNGFYIKAIIDELVGMLFESYDEVTPDGGLGENTELKIGIAKHLQELFFYYCDELHKNGILPEGMHGYKAEQQ